MVYFNNCLFQLLYTLHVRCCTLISCPKLIIQISAYLNPYPHNQLEGLIGAPTPVHMLHCRIVYNRHHGAGIARFRHVSGASVCWV